VRDDTAGGCTAVVFKRSDGMEKTITITKILTKENVLNMLKIKDNYSAHIITFYKWFINEKNIPENDIDIIKKYFIYLNNSSYKKNSILLKRAALVKRIYIITKNINEDYYFYMKGLIISLKAKDGKVKDGEYPYITKDNIITDDKFLFLIQKVRSNRQKMFMMFLYETGVRISELCGIRLADCEDQGGAVKIRVLGKGRKERFIRIPSALFDEIREVFKGSVWLFETQTGKPYNRRYPSDQLSKLSKKYLNQSLSPHKYRHGFCTRQIENKDHYKNVSKYLGHSSLDAFKIYDHSIIENNYKPHFINNNHC